MMTLTNTYITSGRRLPGRMATLCWSKIDIPLLLCIFWIEDARNIYREPKVRGMAKEVEFGPTMAFSGTWSQSRHSDCSMGAFLEAGRS